MIRISCAAILAAALLLPGPASADEQLACLSRQEQRAAIASGQAVKLAAAIHSVRGTKRAKNSREARSAREVVKARLCRQGKDLVYVLTVVARDGKVSRTTVDAGSGQVVVDVR